MTSKTFSPEVWGDVLRRLQDEIPDFAFDAWIVPLAVKVQVENGRIALGCQNSFHRDRIRNHYAEAILSCWQSTRSESAPEDANAGSIELLTMNEFSAAAGVHVESQWAARNETRSALERPSMSRVAAGDTRTLAATAHDVAHSVAHSAACVGSHAEPLLASSGGGRSESLRVSSTAAFSDAYQASSERHATGLGGTQEATPTLHALPNRKQRVPTPKKPRKVRLDASPKPMGRSNGAVDADSEVDAQPVQPELPFSFESFVVGPCNALAREAALALARGRQRSLNQLYLAGDSGMGKTHLARATATEARRHGQHSVHPSAFSGSAPAPRESTSRVVYTSAEQFTSEFVSAMRHGNSEQWKRRYRGPIGMLIVEDVQFFSGRTKTQLELFHTVQHVLDAGGSVLLTGDRAPRDLVGLDERMRDQVGRGFVAELERPDALVRRHLLRSKAAAGGVHLPADCLDLLVESSAGSVRDVESILIQVVTTASLLGRAIDLDLTNEAVALKSGAGTSLAPKTLALTEIVRIVATFFGKRPEALAGRSRRRDVLIPRQLAMYLAHRYSDASFKEIGRSLGRDHPAVRNAITRIERLVLENAPLRYQVEALSERLDQTLKRPDQSIEAPSAPQ